ncbi:MAG: hypothetical protein ACI9IV_002251 [Paracoccaceae bacterium]|jgi:hypothetical protein|tara:strand:+ start:213 stop:407 length:195 start_codon:yes stop_codon:yes gene_type:complete
MQPAFTRPDLGNIACSFLVWLIRNEVAIQQIWRNVELVIAVSRHFLFAGFHYRTVVLAYFLTGS